MRRVEQRKNEGRRERGTVMVLVAGSVVVLLLFAALTVDMGLVWSSRTQNQNAGDGAALAAAGTMINPAGPSVTLAASRAAAKSLALDNSTVGNTQVTLVDSDLEYGYWDLDTREFYADGESLPNGTTVDTSDPDLTTAAKVDVRMDGTDNARSPAVLSRLLSMAANDGTVPTGFTVNNEAIGYLGFDGDWDPAEFDLPIAIDSCELVSDSDGCGEDFCELSQYPDNPCLLSNDAWQQGDDQSGSGDVTCLLFSPTTDQNACWTDFETDSSVNSSNLRDIVENGNPVDVSAGDSVNVDNGDKTSVQKEIREKMYGEASYSGNPAGEDRYPEVPPAQQGSDYKDIDSWVVKLPVIECQDADHCAGGDNVEIIGGVCFQIREVTGPPDRLVKGRFLCPDDPDPEVRTLYQDYCGDPPGDQDAPGGCNFGDRAERVVLVK